MDAYDTSAEYLRTRVERLAEEITQQIKAQRPDTVVAFFISDVVDAVENVVGGVVDVAQDAVNEAVNVTHDVVNAVVDVGERAINAAEDAVQAVAAHAQQVVHVAKVATEIIQVVTLATDLIGGGEVPAGPSGQRGTQASAAELVKARRTLIRQQRSEASNNLLAKRSELKARIAAISARVAASRRT